MISTTYGQLDRLSKKVRHLGRDFPPGFLLRLVLDDLLCRAICGKTLVGLVDVFLQLGKREVTAAGLQLQNVAARLREDTQAALAQTVHRAMLRQARLVTP